MSCIRFLPEAEEGEQEEVPTDEPDEETLLEELAPEEEQAPVDTEEEDSDEQTETE